MKKRHWYLALGMLASLRSMACSGEAQGPDDGAGTGGTTSEEGVCDEYAEAAGWLQGEPVEAAATSTPARISAIGEQTWNLSLKMLAAVPSSEVPNLAQSATSFYAAMGMAYERYRNGHSCGPAIKTVLEFPEDGMELHHSIGAGLIELQKREIPSSEDSDGVTLNMSNSVWAIQSDQLPEPSELQTIYGATSNATEGTGEPVRELMNCLIERDSKGLLVDFIPPGMPNPDTFTADINVAYLAAPWDEEMNPGLVDFTAEGASLAQVDGLLAYGVHRVMYDAETFTTIELPLLGRELSVMFVVPNDTFVGTMDDFVGSLTHEMLAEARLGAESRYIDFQMPKVDIASVTLDYKTELEIDCDPIGGLQAVFHGAAVEMDEKGIKAAAATVVFGDGDSAPPPPEEFFHIDRPFLFFVHDPATGYSLFSGRYLG